MTANISKREALGRRMPCKCLVKKQNKMVLEFYQVSTYNSFQEKQKVEEDVNYEIQRTL